MFDTINTSLFSLADIFLSPLSLQLYLYECCIILDSVRSRLTGYLSTTYTRPFLCYSRKNTFIIHQKLGDECNQNKSRSQTHWPTHPPNNCFAAQPRGLFSIFRWKNYSGRANSTSDGFHYSHEDLTYFHMALPSKRIVII